MTVRTATTAIERDSRAFLTLSMQAMEGAAPHRPSALRALLALDDHSTATIGALSETLGLSQSATSRLVDKLRRSGLVDQVEHGGDRRQVAVASTSEGRAVVAGLVARRREAVQRVVARMTPGDLEALERGLAAFGAAAAAVVQSTPAEAHRVGR